MKMTDEDALIATRVARVRGDLSVDMTDMEPAGLAACVSFRKGEMAIYFIPTAGDTFVAIEAFGFVDGVKRFADVFTVHCDGEIDPLTG